MQSQKEVIETVSFLSFIVTRKKAIENLQRNMSSKVLFLPYLFPKKFLVNYSHAHMWIG